MFEVAGYLKDMKALSRPDLIYQNFCFKEQQQNKQTPGILLLKVLLSLQETCVKQLNYFEAICTATVPNIPL